MASELSVSSKLWQCFEVASKASREAKALLDEVNKLLKCLNLGTEVIQRQNSNEDKVNLLVEWRGDWKREQKVKQCQNWVEYSMTCNYRVKSKSKSHSHVLSIQIVFFTKGNRRNCNRATLNIVCSPYYEGEQEENYWFGDYLVECEENECFWNGLSIACMDRLLWKKDDDGRPCWAFSYPVHAIGKTADIREKIVHPILELLKGDDPNNLSLPRDALMFKKEADGKIVVANNE
ncbi:hypothetical protein D6779_10745 [Candidatus Parcubacteria bacterium]|nr:MAG: hypothetical protein D6779_10745 [Candidatus Parcubacteria bacterium]